MLLFSTKIQRLVEVAVVFAAAVVVVVVVAVVVKDVKNGSTKEAFILLKMGINYPSMKFLSQQAADVVAAKVGVAIVDVVVAVVVDAFIAFVVVVVVHDVGVD